MSESSAVVWIADRERLLWIGAILCYGLGDTATTIWGLSAGGVTEVGPIVGPMLDRHGVAGMIFTKVGSLAVFVAVWAVLRRPARTAVPFALFAVGGGVTAWNLLSIAPTILDT